MKDELISPQSVHNRYRVLLRKFPKIGFSEIELRDYLMKIGCLHEDYIKTVPISEGKMLELSDLYLQKRDWKISPRDAHEVQKSLRGEK